MKLSYIPLLLIQMLSNHLSGNCMFRTCFGMWVKFCRNIADECAVRTIGWRNQSYKGENR